jgi:hypothetical protein
MKFKIGFMLLILVAAVAAPYFIKGRDGKPLMEFGKESLDILSTEKTRQQYQKWQDENGVWHFGDDIPEGVQAEVVNVDTAANIIRSVKIAREEEEERDTPAKISTPSLPIPMTVDPTEISEMMDNANDIQKLMDDRASQLEAIQ